MSLNLSDVIMLSRVVFTSQTIHFGHSYSCALRARTHIFKNYMGGSELQMNRIRAGLRMKERERQSPLSLSHFHSLSERGAKRDAER